MRQRVFSMQRRRWNTYCRLRTNVKQQCKSIMRSNEMFKEMKCAKTNDQQWYGVVPDSCDVRKTWTQCMSVSGHIRDQCSAVRAGVFGSTETFNDRRCITTDNTTLMSVEDTTDNCRFFLCFSMGLQRGETAKAGVTVVQEHWRRHRKETTQPWALGTTCRQYTPTPYAYHVASSAEYSACPSSEYSIPSLSSCSESSYLKAYRDDKDQCIVQPQHRGRNPAGFTQQTVLSSME